MVRAASLLLERGANPSLVDNRGNTALTLIGQKTLTAELYDESFQLARVLLEHGSDPNHVDLTGRTLLSYGVAHADQAQETTRLLFNHGARVLPSRVQAAAGTTPALVAKERDQSAFTWFLRAVMRRNTLERADVTVKLLCQAMAQDLGSAKMKLHVLSTMVYLGNCGTPGLFLQLKQHMSAYWREPQPLKPLCLQTIRKSIGPKNLSQGAEQLRLPKPLTSFLQLY